MLPLPFSRATTFGRWGSSAKHLCRNAFLVEHLLEVVGRRLLASRRVAGVEAQQRLEVAHGLVFELGPVRLTRGPVRRA